MKNKLLKTIKLSTLSLFLISFSACDPYKNLPKNLIDVYPSVYNLQGLNTEYDDYNSGLPPSYIHPQSTLNDLFFVYSTNSGTQGKNFDIWKGWIKFEQNSKIEGEKNPPPKITSERIEPFFKNEVNSEFNEFGPYMFYVPNPQDVIVSPPAYTSPYGLTEETFNDVEKNNYGKNLASKPDSEILNKNLYFFSSDRKGKRDIYFYSNKKGLQEFFGNKSDSNESYFTYDYKHNIAYFASDRNGKYSIYKFENKTGNFNFDEIFSNPEYADQITEVKELNSTGNDTCPIIIDDLMIFASDREGGRGGYDLYISQYFSNGWSKPKNIQDNIDSYIKYFPNYLKEKDLNPSDFQINTEADEFRPVIFEDLYYRQYTKLDKTGESYDNNPSQNYEQYFSMIFSSNRSGGKGGFDLHLAILPRKFI